MSAHTPGPWHWMGGAVGIAHQGQASEADQLIPIALLPNPSDWDQKEWRANALLITAAPDMLAALRRAAVVLAFLCEQDESGSFLDEYNAVDSAIRKATKEAA